MLYKHQNNSEWNKRSGFTIFEAFISLILVSTAVSITIPTLRVVNLQRKTLNERLIATTTLANLSERLKAEETWNSLTSQRLDSYQEEVTKELSLKEPKLAFDLIENPKLPAIKQLIIQLTWQNPYGEIVDPVSLSIWFYELEDNT